MPTWPIVAFSLVAGFGVADATGVRALGGIVLAAALAWCFLRWRERAGTARAAGLGALYLGAFAASHGLGHLIGAWPSVLVVATLSAWATWAIADVHGRPPAPRGT